jgi:hypothetical protein
MVKFNMKWIPFSVAIVLSLAFDLVIFGIWFTGWFSNYESHYSPGFAGFLIACGCGLFMDFLAFLFAYSTETK